MQLYSGDYCLVSDKADDLLQKNFFSRNSSVLQEIHFSFDERSAENYLIVMDFTNFFFFMCKLLSIFCNDHLILNTKTLLLRAKEPRDYSIITSNVVHRIHGRK